MEDWTWSSYIFIIGASARPDWLEINWILSHFGFQRKRARANYVNFVREGVGLATVRDTLRHPIYLGGDKFIATHQKALKEKNR
jgi:hypothetical protein